MTTDKKFEVLVHYNYMALNAIKQMLETEECFMRKNFEGESAEDILDNLLRVTEKLEKGE